jgi:predicted GNAT family acetyltransferase
MKPCYVIKEVSAIADLSESDDGAWQIHRINVPTQHRGKGVGRGLLDAICNDADKERVALWLLPIPSGGLSYAQLVDWYARRGFKWQGKVDKSVMRREAR